MLCYIITYDLIQPGRSYENLHNAIRSYERWAKITESVWAVVTQRNAVSIRDHLSTYLDANDRIFVIKSGAEAAWKNTICEHQWLQGNL
jgi:hypothetical protein